MVYLYLFHGRKDPAEELHDWGTEGPCFGPFEGIQITYGNHIKMNAPGGGVQELVWYNRMVFYDGVFYGDLVVTDQPDAKTLARLKKYDEDRIILPEAILGRKRPGAKSR